MQKTALTYTGKKLAQQAWKIAQTASARFPTMLQCAYLHHWMRLYCFVLLPLIRNIFVLEIFNIDPVHVFEPMWANSFRRGIFGKYSRLPVGLMALQVHLDIEIFLCPHMWSQAWTKHLRLFYLLSSAKNSSMNSVAVVLLVHQCLILSFFISFFPTKASLHWHDDTRKF